MKNVKSIKSLLMTMSVVTAATFLVACDKNTARRSDDNAVNKAKCVKGFDLDKSMNERFQKIEQAGLKDQIVVRTVIQKNAPKGDMAKADGVMLYLDKNLDEYTNSPEAISLTKDCENLSAKYLGVGAEQGFFQGTIKTVKKNSILIEGIEKSSGAKTTIEITEELAKIDKKSDQGALQAKLNEDLGLGQIKIEIKSRSKTGSKHMIALQSFEKKSDPTKNGSADDKMVAVDTEALAGIMNTLGDDVPAHVRAAYEQAVASKAPTVAISTETFAKLNEIAAQKLSADELQEVVVIARHKITHETTVNTDTDSDVAVAGTDLDAQAQSARAELEKKNEKNASATEPLNLELEKALETAEWNMDAVTETSVLSLDKVLSLPQIPGFDLSAPAATTESETSTAK